MGKHSGIAAIAGAAALVLSGAVFAQATTVLTGTVRDFVPGPLVPGYSNPDFEAGIGGVNTGMVSSVLSGSAPTYVGSGGYGSVSSAASFAEWYGPAAPSTALSITLTETSPGIFTYSNNSFFPINGALLGDYGGSGLNYHFTYQIAATFGYTPGAGQTFAFSGDDDIWVFFDKKLGIDLGGIHGTAGASVNLDTLFGPGKAAGNYAFDFYFAERHTVGSNFSLATSLNLVTTPVPEPETYAMLLAGLGLLGFAARRRKMKEAAAA